MCQGKCLLSFAFSSFVLNSLTLIAYLKKMISPLFIRRINRDVSMVLFDLARINIIQHEGKQKVNTEIRL